MVVRDEGGEEDQETSRDDRGERDFELGVMMIGMAEVIRIAGWLGESRVIDQEMFDGFLTDVDGREDEIDGLGEMTQGFDPSPPKGRGDIRRV